VTGSFTGTLRCERCGTVGPEPAAPVLCPVCAADGVHVYPWPVYDLTRMAALPTPDPAAGIFRWAPLLPVDQANLRTLGEAGTPLLPIPRFGTAIGLLGLLLKNESQNPTWSYKDRLAAVAVNRAAQRGADTVVVSSTGNHGAAVAAYAARLGLRCVVLTVASVPLAMKVLMQSYGAQVVAFDQPGERWTLMRQAVAERGWVPMSGYVSPPSGSNPIGVDGYKSLAYEMWEQLGGAMPDAIVAPVAYGDGVAGMARGFDDLVSMGLADRIPRIIAAEPYGPYGAALASGIEDPATPVPMPAPSVAFSIATPMPTWQGLWALRHTAGAAPSADDAATMSAQQRLSAAGGLFLEPSAAITLAVLPGLLARGAIRDDERIVVLATSTGLKDVPIAAEQHQPVPVIEPTLDAFDRAVAHAGMRSSGA
jgi:threonine synthase